MVTLLSQIGLHGCRLPTAFSACNRFDLMATITVPRLGGLDLGQKI